MKKGGNDGEEKWIRIIACIVRRIKKGREKDEPYFSLNYDFVYFFNTYLCLHVCTLLDLFLGCSLTLWGGLVEEWIVGGTALKWWRFWGLDWSGHDTVMVWKCHRYLCLNFWCEGISKVKVSLLLYDHFICVSLTWNRLSLLSIRGFLFLCISFLCTFHFRLYRFYLLFFMRLSNLFYSSQFILRRCLGFRTREW